MKKFWLVYSIKNSGTFLQFDSLEKAVAEAKRMQAADSNNQFVVMESVQVTVRPVPSIEMETL